MSTLYTLQSTDTISSTFDDINTNFSALNTDKAETSALTSGLATKQATLVSGTNIKTVNGNSLLGSGDISISATANVAVKDEGSTIASSITSIDFVGGGVSATNTGTDITVTIAGVSNGDTTTKGVYELATDAEIDSMSSTGGTGANLVTTPSQVATRIPVNSGNDGADGALSISSGTTTLTATNGYVEKFYTDLTISGTATLGFSGKSTNGLIAIINVSGNFTMSGGTIDLDGQGGDAGQDGFGIIGTTISKGTTVQTAGAARPLPIGFTYTKACGGGGATGPSGGGAGGVGGGMLLIRVKGAVNFTSGTIKANGTAGAAGGGTGGGGGGGGGGMILVMGSKITSSAGTIQVNGGNGGNGGTTNLPGGGGGGSYSAGGNGGNSAPSGANGANGSSNSYGSGGTGGTYLGNGGGGGGGGAGYKYIGKFFL